LSWWNFNSATSLISGLRGAKFPLHNFPQFQTIIDLNGDYEGYWIYQSRYPGIPWMFPLKRFIQKPPSILKAQEKAEMFPISLWISNVQERAETGNIDMDGKLVDTLKEWKEKEQEMNANGRVCHSFLRTLRNFLLNSSQY
jgi:hypothetical protein